MGASFSELNKIRGRLEKYFDLANGDLSSEKTMERLRMPSPYSPQNSTGGDVSVEHVLSAKDQAVCDLWRLLQVAKVAPLDDEKENPDEKEKPTT